MNRKQLKAQLRAEAIEEARQDEESEIRAERTLRRWKRATTLLGILLMASVAALVPFLAGHSLYSHWEKIGKKVLLLSMGLLGAFAYTAGHTWIEYWYGLRELRKIHKKYAPLGSKYRTGARDPGLKEK
jgi:hypothetical protein